jgi:hypothetical protein
MSFISSVIESALHKSFDNNLNLRKGLNINFFRNVLVFVNKKNTIKIYNQ